MSYTVDCNRCFLSKSTPLIGQFNFAEGVIRIHAVHREFAESMFTCVAVWTVKPN